MLIAKDQALFDYIKENLEINPNWEKRDFVYSVKKYVEAKVEKVLAISGLKGTGKTTGILQAVNLDDTVYILAQRGESETSKDYIDFIKKTDKKIIIIDEYSWISDRNPLDKYLITAVQNGKRLIITANESIALEYLQYGDSIHRLHPLHTTMFTYEEYLRVFNKTPSCESMVSYLSEGGLFKDYILKNFESTRKYVEEAIIENLSGYLKDLTFEKAKALTYAVIFKAICPSNLFSIPALKEEHMTLENFLEEMGINTDIIPEEKEIKYVADIFEQAGIIVRIPNFDKESVIKERYYIVNPSIS